MLRELHVRDLALIEEATLEFGRGLNVLSGETGAGKTVLVGALELLLGGRGDSSMVRDGAGRLEVEAAFGFTGGILLEAAEKEGLDLADDEEIVIRRIMTADGKGRCYVNGTMCTVGTLSRLGENLVDIHGQHEHQRLLRPASHLDYLDASGAPAHHELLQDYRGFYARWREARGELEIASMDEAERLREIDLLRFQVREIEAAAPGEGEMEELLKERRRMQNREELFNAVRDAYILVGGETEEGALDRVGSAEAVLEKASSLDEDVSAWMERLREAQGQLADLVHELRAYAESLQFEPGRLEEVELRLRVLSELARKYGRDTALILEHLERARKRLAELENLDARRDGLREEVASRQEELAGIAAKLTAARTDLAGELAGKVNRELAELNMAGMRLSVELKGGGDFGERGMDEVEFKISPGQGLPYQPIRRIASGGELSRIMLALKLSLARADDVPTLVFDEVDAGIGGTTADVLAEKLSRISAYHQVFSITHLPQVAALADTHMAVCKRETSRGIVTEVEFLDRGRRIDELARMLGGNEGTARKHAQSMLKRKEAADA
jgi:DNA repair protein RecN (Recombination protein N)